MKESEGFKHWLLPDHLSFLLLFPAILWSWSSPSLLSIIVVLCLYWITLLYDVAEEKIPYLKRLELRIKRGED